jgi:hypothetical protein
MIGSKNNGVRRLSRVKTWALWRSLGRRANQLWERMSPSGDVPERNGLHTAIDGQLAVEAEANVTEIENGSVQALRKPKRKRNKREAKLELQRHQEAKAKERFTKAEEALEGFLARFPHAVEQLVKHRASRWKFAITVVLALAGESALTYLAMSYIAPNVGENTGLPPVVTWALSNLSLIGTVSIVWASGLLTKSAGREAAWAFNGLTAAIKEYAEEMHPAGARGPLAVYSDRSRLSHQVAFGAITALLLGLIVGLVLLREPALALLGNLSGGSHVGGLAGANAKREGTDGTLLFVGLFLVSVVPLFAAGWVSYLRESPLANCLAALTKDAGEAHKALVRIMKGRGATEAEIANVGVGINATLAERDANQVLARLVPHMGHEVMVEAQPELFGAVSTEPHPLLKPAGELGSPFPRGGDVAQERFPTKPDPTAPEPDVTKVLIDRGSYVPPPEVKPEPNGNGPTESAWAGRS